MPTCTIADFLSVKKQRHNLNLDSVDYLGYIRSHLELVKKYFAYSMNDISNAAAAVLTGLWGITSLQMMPLKPQWDKSVREKESSIVYTDLRGNSDQSQ